MNARTFIVHKAGDSTRESVRSNLHAAVDALDPKDAWRIDIKRYRKPRSEDANAYLWAVAYVCIVRELGFTAEEWHEEMCMRYFGKREVRKPSGVEWKPVRTTTTNEHGERDVLPGKEFWEFVEFLRRQAAEGGVYIPEPDPFWKDRRAEVVRERKAA